MKDLRKTNYTYMEYLRVISAFAVIVIHVSGANWFRLDIGSGNWIIQTMFNLAGRFSVCVFAMISGALMLRPGKEISMHDIVHKYIKRILICYVAWTALYAVLYTVMNDGDAAYFILHLFQIPKHLWYLLMLIALYLSIPILKKITEDRRLTLYMIWIMLIFGAVFGTVSGLTGFFKEMTGDSLGYSLWSAFLGDLDNMNILFVPGYLGFFLLGHYVHEYGLGRWEKTIVRLAIPSLLLSGLLTIILSVVTQRYIYTLMLETNPLVVLGSVGLFALFKGAKGQERTYDPDSVVTKTVLTISINSFGIYLVHLAVLDCLEHYLHFTVASYPAILSVPLNSLLVLSISFALAALLRKIPGVRRIVS